MHNREYYIKLNLNEVCYVKEHYRLIVLGAGAGGITSTSMILRKKKKLKGDTLIIDPGDYHYFQPGFPLVGSGELKLEDTRKRMVDVIPKGAVWEKSRVIGVDPKKREVTTGEKTFTYDYLLIALGLELDFGAIEGVKESLGKNGVTTTYLYDYLEYTYRTLKEVKHGNIIITKPKSEIKGAVAAENSLFTMKDFEEIYHHKNVQVLFRSGRDRLFKVDKYNQSLTVEMEKQGIDYKLDHELVRVDSVNRFAMFKDLKTGAVERLPFELLVITPPQRGPSVLKNSPLIDEEGWVSVDNHTLRHTDFPTIFGLGDATNLPITKMAASVRKQVPVVVQNIIDVMDGRSPSKRYNGDTAAPIATELGRLILAEYDYERIPKETTFLDQSKSNLFIYQFKKRMIPFMYWNGMMNGRT